MIELERLLMYKNIRICLGLTAKDLAEDLNTSSKTISSMEPRGGVLHKRYIDQLKVYCEYYNDLIQQPNLDFIYYFETYHRKHKRNEKYFKVYMKAYAHKQMIKLSL